MVSQRQRLARKKFKEAHPELFPKQEPTSPKDPTKRKGKSKFKRKARTLDCDSKPQKSGYKKHPLRVPGLKPGDGCFICKAKDHPAKLCPEKAQWEKNKICLLCRQRGHTLKKCPNKSDDSVDVKMCYNCGETGHSLSNCLQPLKDGGTKYASCFICKEQGHLSKNCPKNTHGIYPKGGGCKICGGVTHLAKDCPEKQNKFSGGRKAGEEGLPRARVPKFFSGDDLEDDFMINDQGGSDKNSSNSVQSKDKQMNTTKVSGHKVVNFVG